MRPATSLIGRSSGRRPSSVSIVSYATAATFALASCVRELGLGREVQVRVEDQALAEEAVLRRERLLHLDDHLRAPRVGGARERSSRRRATYCSSVMPLPSPALVLDEHVVAVRDELAHARGRHRRRGTRAS